MSYQLHQLDMFSFFTAPAPVAAAPVTPPAPVPVAPAQADYTIEHNPLKGFKVVLAPGLTTGTRKNPCSVCSKGLKDKDSCSEKCTLYSARLAYLEQLGAPLVGGVDCREGSYGIAN